MNLYLVERTDGFGLEEYRNLVVAAENEDDARHMHPCHFDHRGKSDFGIDHLAMSKKDIAEDDWREWAWMKPSELSTMLRVTLIGTSHLTTPTIILVDDSFT
jgi:hypothetical protein